MSAWRAVPWVLVACVACGGDEPTRSDGGPRPDAFDPGDMGVERDAGPPPDAGPSDAGPPVPNVREVAHADCPDDGTPSGGGRAGPLH